MILLTGTSETLELITGQAVSTITVHVSYIDHNSGTFTPGDAEFNITTATTTTIVSAPSSGTQRNIKGVYITNNNTSSPCQVTVKKNNGTITADLMGVTLLPGENCILDSNGNWNHHDAQGGEYVGRGQSDIFTSGSSISGALSETIPRMLCVEVNLSALTSGTLLMTAIYLIAGQKINNISFHSATTAAGTPTNQFFALYNINRALLAQTSNATTTAWAANSIATRALTATYTVQYTGLHYVGIMVTATTVPTLKGYTAKVGGQLAGQTPVLHGNSTTGLTTSLPNPAAAITTGVNAVWAAVS